MLLQPAELESSSELLQQRVLDLLEDVQRLQVGFLATYVQLSTHNYLAICSLRMFEPTRLCQKRHVSRPHRGAQDRHVPSSS